MKIANHEIKDKSNLWWFPFLFKFCYALKDDNNKENYYYGDWFVYLCYVYLVI